MGDFHAVICGGGVAATEGLLRLRSIAGDSVDVTLVAPNDEFVYRPLAVREAVGSGWGRRYGLRGIAEHTGADWIKDTLAWVDAPNQTAHTGGGRAIRYDALLVAVGGRQVADLEHATTFRDAAAGEVYEQVVRDVEEGTASSAAFVVPEGPVYPLPAYELALMTAEAARRAGREEVRLWIVTPEPIALAAFGGSAGAVVSRLLVEARIRLYASALAHAPGPHELVIQPQGVELAPDRIVALPHLTGPSVRGLAGGGAHGFIPIDSRCRVPGTQGRVFAAGDATAFRSSTAASALSRRTRRRPGWRAWPVWPTRAGCSARRSAGSSSPGASPSTSVRRWSVKRGSTRRSPTLRRGRSTTRSSPRSSAPISRASTGAERDRPPRRPRRRPS